MANTIKGLTVEIGGDTTKLGKALEDVNKKSRNLSSELGQINKLLKMDPGNADLLAQKQEVLAEAVENTSKKLATLKEAEAQVQEQFKRGEVSAEQVRELQREIVATEKKLNGYESAARETADAVEKLGKTGGNLSLSDTVSEQEAELKKLKKQYVDVVAAEGKKSASAKALEADIKSLSNELADNKTQLAKAEKEADKATKSLDNLEKEAKDAGDASGSMGSKLANAAKVGLQAVATAATAVVGALVGAAEATRDYRMDMGKLDTAFTQNGFTAEQATGAYKELVGVLGESDQAVETANHLAVLTDNEKDLATWTGDILPGVFATFGDSLPIEGLTEAANETAKVGQVTGPLADALNWAGVSEDAFNESLAACSDEQERQALITETLAGLYGDASEAYKETNAEVIRANQANDAWMESMAGVGAAFEPVMTDVKMMGASLLSDLVPGVEAVSEAFRGVLSGEDGAAAALGDALGGIITDLLNKVTELAPTIVQVATSLITSLLTTLISMLPQLLTTGITLLTTIMDGLTSAIPQITAAIVDMIPQLVDALVSGLPQLLTGAIQLFSALLAAIPQITVELVKAAPDIIAGLVQGLISAIPAAIEGILSVGRSILDAIKNFFGIHSPSTVFSGIGGNLIDGLVNGVKNLPTALWNAISGAVSKVAEWGRNLVSNAKTAATNFLSNVASTLRNIPSSVASAISGAISNVVSWGSNMLSRAKTAMANVVSGVTNTLKNLPSKVLSIGKDLVSGLWNGITNKLQWLKDKISGFASSVLGSIKSFFGVNSPSKETAWIGDMLDQGLAEGLLDNMKDPVKAMQKVTTGVLGAADEVDGITLTRQLQASTAAATASQWADSGILGKLDSILSAIERGQIITLDGEALVGSTYERYDTKLGQRRVLAARGALA